MWPGQWYHSPRIRHLTKAKSPNKEALDSITELFAERLQKHKWKNGAKSEVQQVTQGEILKSKQRGSLAVVRI